MGPVISTCASLLDIIDEDEFNFVDEGDAERLAVEELLQDAAGAGFPVEITIECRDLPDKDKFSKSDPFVTVYIPTPEGKKLIGRTETVQNNLNPQFVTPVVDNYSPNDDHDVSFSVYHLAHPGEKEEKQQLLGEFTASLDSLMKSPTTSYALTDPHTKKKAGTITLMLQKIKNVQEEITMVLSATGLERFGRSAPHPFLTISRVQRNRLIPVAKTNIARSTTEPRWKPLKVKSFRLCKNDFNLPLQLQVHSGDPGGNHRYIGSAKTTLSTLLSGAVRKFPVLKERKIGKKGYVNSGEIHVLDVKRSAPNSFLDYVKGGAEINCTLAVDMSSSNYPTGRQPLHSIHPDRPLESENDYTRALRSVCKVVGRYDKDQMFPMYGFGAVVPALGKEVQKCFPLNFNHHNPEVQGVEAVIETYIRSVCNTEPTEPTHLAPVIRKVIQDIDDGRDSDESEDVHGKLPAYQLLVILTDGEISDMTETIDAAVDASALPMSILIVGMGDPKSQARCFELMNKLDNPDEPLRSVVTGKTIRRDIINFIVFDEYKNATPNDFARGALAEIPRHFLSWVDMTGYTIKNLGISQHKSRRDLLSEHHETSHGDVSPETHRPASLTFNNLSQVPRTEVVIKERKTSVAGSDISSSVAKDIIRGMSRQPDGNDLSQPLLPEPSDTNGYLAQLGSAGNASPSPIKKRTPEAYEAPQVSHLKYPSRSLDDFPGFKPNKSDKRLRNGGQVSSERVPINPYGPKAVARRPRPRATVDPGPQNHDSQFQVYENGVYEF